MSRRFSQSTLAESWQFLVIRSVRWQHLRPEKSWKPIICLELDGRPCHELILGVDGQNPNLQNPAVLLDAQHASKMHIHMYYQGTSKAKTKKKRKLVASASICLGEAAEKQAHERHIEVRLDGITAVRRKSIAQKAQPCTSLLVCIRPPQSYVSESPASSVTMVNDDGEHSRTSSPTRMEDSPSEMSEVEDTPPTPPSQTIRRRRRRLVKGFAVNSDEEPEDCYISEECSPSPIDRKSVSWHWALAEEPVKREPMIMPSVLPLVRVNTTMSVASSTSLQTASSLFDAVTYYRDLREAETDARLEDITGRIVFEWQYIGATLLSVAALDTTVFGFNAGQTMFNIDSVAVRSLTISAVAAALGLAVDAYLFFTYFGVNVDRFRSRATGIYSNYAFFALTSRLPLLCAVVSLSALSIFLLAVAFSMWPGAVLYMCAAVGMLVSLQYLCGGMSDLATKEPENGEIRRVGGEGQGENTSGWGT
ncbi:hypothetical protein K488DRAFT_88720 [Vararia minispora EC-137]|uniref:Uncharacterized protein n=1 Tax=Vararia minispora EC-137 TaxID=1314806 RepID=A0ACB8QCI1_9AGAM|nr:hypothetical protein K488DRAFT_88720 [Vararia minispora EC-137]